MKEHSMNVPTGLKYADTHEWLRAESDGTVTIGITDHAQAALGDLVYIDLPKAGRRVEAGEACAVVESVKAASDVYAPLAGEVVAGNDALAGAPEAVNEDAYAAWLFRLRPGDPEALSAFMDADAYKRLIAES
jgi:glycine cleavage system H protein